MATVSVNVRLPSEHLAILRLLALANDRSVSDEIRRSIRLTITAQRDQAAAHRAEQNDNGVVVRGGL